MAVEGNDVVLGVFENEIREIKKGRISGGAVITTDAGGGLRMNYQTMTGLQEYILLYALSTMHDEVKARLKNRQAPGAQSELNGKNRANRLVWNGPNLTPGYDFLAWIVAQEMRRIKEGVKEPLEVAFVMAKDWERDPYDKLMVENVMLPLVGMIGGGPSKVNPPDETFVWPASVTFREAVELFNEGIPIPRLKLDPAIVPAVPKGVVTITLRESHVWPQRNSDLEVWLKVAYWLEQRGEKVLFVRDTDKADEPLEGYETLPLASKDINYRAALYAQAKCNLFISNGPATLDWFCGDAPSMMFVTLSEDDGYKCNKPSWWPIHHGIKAGDQFPWFKGTKKRIVWEAPTFEAVTKAYEDLMDG